MPAAAQTPIKTPAPSIVRPGPSPQGPEGWEERRLEREAALLQPSKGSRRRSGAGGAGGKRAGDLAALANPATAEASSTANSATTGAAAGDHNGSHPLGLHDDAPAHDGQGVESGGALANVKAKVRKVGARLSLVEPKASEMGSTRKEASHQDASTGPE